MKKTLLIILICAYAFSTMGIGFKEFYCCGKLKSVFLSLADNSKPQCTKEGCCKTKYQFFKLNDNHVSGTDIYLPVKHSTAVYFYPTSSDIASSFAQQTAQVHCSHAPPNDDTPLYLSNRVFRI